MAYNSTSLLGPTRQIGSADGQLRRSARRLQRQGFRHAAERMAFAGETARLERGSGITRYEDRVEGERLAEVQNAAINKIRMQRLSGQYGQPTGAQPATGGRPTKSIYTFPNSSQPNPLYPKGGASTPQTTLLSKPSATAPAARPSTASPVPAGAAGIPLLGDVGNVAAAASDARRRSMREELDRVTGSTGAGNMKEMQEDYDKSRAEAIKTARTRTTAEAGTTRGGVIDEINKARRAAGQKEFTVSGKDFADIDRAEAESKLKPVAAAASATAASARPAPAAAPLATPVAPVPDDPATTPPTPAKPIATLPTNPLLVERGAVDTLNRGVTNPEDVKFESPLRAAAIRFKQEEDKKLKAPLRSAWLAGGSAIASSWRNLTQTY